MHFMVHTHCAANKRISTDNVDALKQTQHECSYSNNAAVHLMCYFTTSLIIDGSMSAGDLNRHPLRTTYRIKNVLLLITYYSGLPYYLG